METSPQVASLCQLDDSRQNKRSASEFQLYHHTNLFYLVPEIKVIAVGRECIENPIYENRIMAALGLYSIEQCGFDCKELLRSTCRIITVLLYPSGSIVNPGSEWNSVVFTPLKRIT